MLHTFVKIHANRDYPAGLYEVTSITGNGTGKTYNLTHKDTKAKVSIFAAHTFQDLECKRASAAAREEGAQKILSKGKKK